MVLIRVRAFCCSATNCWLVVQVVVPALNAANTESETSPRSERATSTSYRAYPWRRARRPGLTPDPGPSPDPDRCVGAQVRRRAAAGLDLVEEVHLDVLEVIGARVRIGRRVEIRGDHDPSLRELACGKRGAFGEGHNVGRPAPAVVGRDQNAR